MDEKYFQNLLEDTRAICKEYELLNKEKIINCMASYPSIKSEKNKAIKDIARMQKQKTPKEEIKAAEEKHKILEEEEAKARENILKTLEPLLNEIRLDESKDLKASLMKCAIINQATPKKLAQFCKKQEANSLLISELLDSVDIMMEMITFGGAKNGNWGRAYQIYKELLALVDDTEDSKYIDVQYRLAMAVAVELAEPIEIYGYVSMKEKPKVDPIKRWKHYVGACKRGELDPAFPYFSTWEYRWVVNCEAADDQLQWGRDYLKRYRPDHVVMGDRKWRYAEAVRSDVGYRKPNWTADPRTFQQMVSGGGRCGPRAWYGRFMCKAFGTPSWGVKQPAHAVSYLSFFSSTFCYFEI